MIFEVDLLLFDPFGSSNNSIDDASRVFSQQLGPHWILRQVSFAANDHKPMLGSCDGNIDAILLTDERTWFSAHGWDEDQVELSALGRVNWYHLVLHFIE